MGNFTIFVYIGHVYLITIPLSIHLSTTPSRQASHYLGIPSECMSNLLYIVAVLGCGNSKIFYLSRDK